MPKRGIPLWRGSGPLVPGMPKTSEPKLVPKPMKAALSLSWRVQPIVASHKNVGENVFVQPMVDVWSKVTFSPAAPSQSPTPCASPSAGLHEKVASRALYLPQIDSESLAFQLILMS